MKRIYVNGEDVSDKVQLHSVRWETKEPEDMEGIAYLRGARDISGSFSTVLRDDMWDALRPSTAEQLIQIWGPKELSWWCHGLWVVRHFVNYWLSLKHIDLPYPTEVVASGPARIVSTEVKENTLSAEYTVSGDWTFRAPK